GIANAANAQFVPRIGFVKEGEYLQATLRRGCVMIKPRKLGCHGSLSVDSFAVEDVARVGLWIAV
ncbi:hypothetical protein, partial [Paraburkholderia graminis]|uniref:hypothetical protein n=1 Tax=Paraburkholderia graminis TaxID=60548 RepID=UPI001E3A1C39